MSNENNTTRRNNRAARIRAMTMGKPLPPRKLSGNELIEQARIQLRKSVEENTEFNNNWGPNSIKNLRAGLPDHDIISRAQNRMAAEIAKAEATGNKEVIFRFPLAVGKKILYALTFLLSILTLPMRFLSHLFGMLRAKVSPPTIGIAPENWGRTRSMIEEGRSGSRVNQMVDIL
jgi:hypothetical protein